MEDIKDKIAKKIISISSAHAPYDIFFDIVQSCVFSLANSFEERHSEKWENTESRYKAIAQKYTPDEFRKFAEVWALWIELADQNWREQQKFHDNLGPVYQALQMSNKHAGQFFTPEHVALLMATLTWDKAKRKEDIDTAGFTTLNEPACGAGVNLLMGAQVMLENGYNPQQQLLIYGSDIDFKCTV